jgi:hypothetical protein
MAKLQQMPQCAAFFHADGSANPVPLQKANKTGDFRRSKAPARPAIDAVAADFSARGRSPDAAQRR